MLRVWRSLGTYEQRAPLLHWLYRIATTMSLKIIENRAKQPGADAEIDYLEPYPDALLDVLLDVLPADTDPAAAAERRESVSPAFIAALQLLPATQRAALILCEVLTWRAAEVANLLDTTVPRGDQRAATRAGVPAATGPGQPRRSRHRGPPCAHPVRRRLASARHRRAGRTPARRRRAADAAREHGVPRPGRGDRILRHRPRRWTAGDHPAHPTRSNGQQALAAFKATEDEDWLPHGLMVFDFEGEAITRITGFPSRTLAQVTHGAPEVAFTGLSPVAGLS
jgi:RNA polymerase sigma-70 factor (ECF subfamily)